MSNREERRPRRLFVSASLVTASSLCAAAALGLGADKIEAYVSADVPAPEAQAVPASTSSQADVSETGVVLVSRPVIQDIPETSAPEASALPDPVASGDVSEADFECLAKIVHHESANQPERVQFAVANVVLNRAASSRFPDSICGVALQRNQFFNVNAYHPENDPRWETSQRIAEEALTGEGPDAAPGALFFRTATYNSNFFRSRPQIAVLGAMAFHR